MAIAFVNSELATDSNGGSVNTQPLFFTPSVGDLVIGAVTSYDQNGGSITPPSGWSLYRLDDYSPNHLWQHGIYFRIIGGGDSWTFTTPAQYTDILITCYSGADAATPLVDVGTSNAGSGVTATGLGITVTNDNSFLFFSHVGYGSGLTSGPSGMNGRNVNYDGVLNWYDLSVSSGATGDKTAVVASDEWSVTMGIIMESSGVAATPKKTLLGVGT